MSSSEAEDEKSVKEDVEILVSLDGHNRIGIVPIGSEGKDMRDMCKQLFPEENLEDKFDLKYYSVEWDAWVDVVQQFRVVEKRLKIKIDRRADPEEVVAESLEEGTNKRKLTSLVGMLMKNRPQMKNSSEGELGPSSSGTRSKKEEIQVHIGWQHCRTTDNPPHYVQVRANHGGGVVPTKMRRTDATYEAVLQKAKDIFFPNGKSTCHGDAEDLEFFLANYRGQSLYDNFSLDALFENKSRARMYLMSRPKGSPPATSHDSPSSSSSSSLMDPFLNEFVASELDSGTPTVRFRVPEPDVQNMKCVICSDRTKTSFFIPCGHCICMPCGSMCLQDTKTCPFCKSTVEKMGSLF
ncbi:hypothetical protein HOLleu_43028 [Holothuria leucospilota]|uniref:RING-type domain-containing protein n=1 Tax=Holothuria leucospilota TaxID=206669 RepID=A0A9Q0YC97_HOLLE|nr:hypothetical protein HOLleu_43028 [Holothuria leucospilota]